jgi:hypothetical protein
MALLRMLTTVLLRSTEARRLVLDFGDDQGFWYVVTESEPRCLILREWLQFELNRAAGEPVPAKLQSAVLSSGSQPSPPKQEETAPGDFTKLFQASQPKAPPSVPAAPPEKTPGSPPPPARSEPGEFTRVFQSFKSETAQPMPITSPAPPLAPKAEQGEFTKLFHGGLPAISSKAPASPEIKRTQDRASRGGFVQRPNTPMPPFPQKSADPGEFTRIFSHPVPENQNSKDLFADYPISTANSRDLFRGSEDLPKPVAPESREPGEYTRIFGGGTVSPPVQPPALITQNAPFPIPSDDPLQGSRHVSVAPAAPPPAQKGPSEYTMVIQGNRPLGDAAGEVSPPASGGGSVPLAGAPVLPKISAPPQMKVPQVSMPKPPAVPAPPQVKVAAPADNKKLIVFLGILAILALALILLVVLIAVKK